MATPRVGTSKAAPKTSSSDVLIYGKLMINLIKKAVPDAGTIPPTNKVFKTAASQYIHRTQIGNHIPTTTHVEKLLEAVEAGVGQLPKSDTKIALEKNIEELIKVLGERKNLREVLFNEFNQIVTEMNKTIQDILGLVAPQPEAQEGNIAIKNTLDAKLKILNNFNTKVTRAVTQSLELNDAVNSLATIYGKVSGVIIKPSTFITEPAPKAPTPE